MFRRNEVVMSCSEFDFVGCWDGAAYRGGVFAVSLVDAVAV